MTVFTDVRRENMRRAFTGRIGTVVAADAVVRDVHMVEVRWKPRYGRVAVVAVITAGDVCRMFTLRRYTVMAGDARADDLGVINDIGRCECHVVVAVLADVSGVDMRGVLADRIGAVMAAHTVVGDVDVIEVCRDPSVRRVAVVAVVAACDMCRVLALGGHAVMTREACADDLGVVDGIGRRKRHHVVAILANVGRIEVRSILADGLHAVMAAEAIARDGGVVEVRRCPRGRYMAVVAIVTAGDMRRMFTRCRNAVVAGDAGPDNVSVIDGPGGFPG